MNALTLYTIGHSNVPLLQFQERLRAHDITTLVDVRSLPRSRFAHFHRGPLEHALLTEGVRYRWFGDRIGGMPRDPRVRSGWNQGSIDPAVLAHLRSTPQWSDGVAALAALLKDPDGGRVCIMCSEGDPSACHRSAVATDTSAMVPGLIVVHIPIRPVPTAPALQPPLL